MSDYQSNWAGSLQYHARHVIRPRTLEELQEAVASADRVKALGSRHSFSDIADTDGVQISLDRMDHVLSLSDAAAGPSVTIEGGLAYGPLCDYLNAHGWALPNMASLPQISVAGACATATHGSGVRNGSLATPVSAITVVTADGSLREIQRGDADFDGAVVGLGALGVVARLTLDLTPAFEMRQDVYEGLPLAAAQDRVDDIMGAAYSVSLFTDWRGPRFTQVWLKSRVGDDRPAIDLAGAAPAVKNLSPLVHSPENCTQQLGVIGPWHERLPHFRMGATPSSGCELQSEYFVARDDAPAALGGVASLADRIAPLLQVCEVRAIAGDQHWMSMAYGRDSAAIHFTWIRDADAVGALLPAIEERLAPFAARPHWGKLFDVDPQALAARYPRHGDFRALTDRWDPGRKFGNAFLDRYVMF